MKFTSDLVWIVVCVMRRRHCHRMLSNQGFCCVFKLHLRCMFSIGEVRPSCISLLYLLLRVIFVWCLGMPDAGHKQQGAPRIARPGGAFQFVRRLTWHSPSGLLLDVGTRTARQLCKCGRTTSRQELRKKLLGLQTNEITCFQKRDF
jgi:hypothetical protein